MTVHVIAVEGAPHYRCTCDTCGADGVPALSAEDAAAGYEGTPAGGHLCPTCAGQGGVDMLAIFTPREALVSRLPESFNDPNDHQPRLLTIQLSVLDALAPLEELPVWCVEGALTRRRFDAALVRVDKVAPDRVVFSDGSVHIRHPSVLPFDMAYEGPILVKSRWDRLAEDEL